jgi:hypothetical protein
MKCDELEKEYLLTNNVKTLSTKMVLAYNADDVDKAIAELKQKLEDAKASHYAEMVDAGMRERRLRRALWLARAERALEKIAWFKLWNASISTMNPEDGTRQEFDKWKKNLGKFLKKAEEYK